MLAFKVPQWVKKHLVNYKNSSEIPDEFCNAIKEKFARFHCENPIVSIMIPAWNEEGNIARTLSSLADLESVHPIEIIVMDNNSTDSTNEILQRCGVKTIFVKKQGVEFARQEGLEMAKGKIHLCADADSIYSPGWVNEYVEILSDEKNSCAYGTLAFIPPEGDWRIFFALFETMKKPVMWLRRKNRVHLNVLGMNFGFRTEDGKKVGGFDYGPRRGEDGWMALKLREYGKVVMLSSRDSVNWTSARRLLDDGSFSKALWRRMMKEFKRIPGYLSKTKQEVKR